MVRKGKVRKFNRDPDYEASSIRVEADVIEDHGKFRGTNVHHAQQIDADGNTRITIRGQMANEGSKTRRPDPNSEISGDEFTIDAREINIHPRSGRTGRDSATARRGVWIYRRKKEE